MQSHLFEEMFFFSSFFFLSCICLNAGFGAFI